MLALLWTCVQTPLRGEFPAARGFVNDFAGVLDDATSARLEALLKGVERETSAEIVLATIPSLEGMTVEEYANRLFTSWGIGKKASDNGVLMLVAPRDRAVRIEVGYGLEPVLPDGLAGEIVRTELVPEFRSGNFAQGVERGLARVARIVRRDPGAVASTAREGNDGRPPALLMVPFAAAFMAFGTFVAGLGVRSKTGGPVLFAALFAGIPFFMSLAFYTVSALAVLAPFGVAMFAFGFRKGASSYWDRMLRGPYARSNTAVASDDGWVMGGNTSGSGDGSSSDGGSSSDTGSSGGDLGGGDSGGGGASGRW